VALTIVYFVRQYFRVVLMVDLVIRVSRHRCHGPDAAATRAPGRGGDSSRLTIAGIMLLRCHCRLPRGRWRLSLPRRTSFGFSCGESADHGHRPATHGAAV
jgi:hypothetical protein